MEKEILEKRLKDTKSEVRAKAEEHNAENHWILIQWKYNWNNALFEMNM